MTATAGSGAEIKEQYGKYGFHFVDIPPFQKSKRKELGPILTNSKYLSNSEAEKRDHLNRIVKEMLHHLSSQKEGQAGPILIHCADKEQGEAIHKALSEAIAKNPQKYESKFQGLKKGIQGFYSSEKPTPEARNQEELAIKDKAGEAGMITISTVFGRGTDIKPSHAEGLYTISTFVDTEPHSSEDLERAGKQRDGRSGRAGQKGCTRLIIRRSEFSDSYTPKQMRDIPETIQGVYQAISELNRRRHAKRVLERETREYFDDLKDKIYQEFFKYIQVVNSTGENVPKKSMRDKLTKQWNLLLSRIDNHWNELQHDLNLKGSMNELWDQIAAFACAQWNELATDNGILRTELQSWSNYNRVHINLPEINPMDAKSLVKTIKTRKPEPERFYVKKKQYTPVDPSVSEAAVYSDFMSSSQLDILTAEVAQARIQASQAYITKQIEWLTTPAHGQKLGDKFSITANDYSKKNVQQIMGALQGCPIKNILIF